MSKPPEQSTQPFKLDPIHELVEAMVICEQLTRAQAAHFEFQLKQALKQSVDPADQLLKQSVQEMIDDLG